MSQKLAVVVGLAFCSLAAHGAETQLQRLKRLAIRPLYPTISQPPSSRIKDGLWKEEDEYGIVRFTNGEKLTNEKINSAKQAAAQADSTKAEKPAAVPVSSGSIAQTGKPPVDSPNTTPSWKKSLAPGSAMAWNRADMPTANVALNSRPTPNSVIRGAGNPENLGQAPGLPAHETMTGDVEYAALSARTTPDTSLRDSVKSTVQQLPSPPPIPKHDTKHESGSVKIPDDRFTTHSLPDLIDMLQSGSSPRFRARIADELGRRGDEAAQVIPALSAALNDSSPLVRASAALAVGNIGGDSVGLQPRLTVLLQDKNPDVKMSAEIALSRLGK